MLPTLRFKVISAQRQENVDICCNNIKTIRH